MTDEELEAAKKTRETKQAIIATAKMRAKNPEASRETNARSAKRAAGNDRKFYFSLDIHICIFSVPHSTR